MRTLASILAALLCACRQAGTATSAPEASPAPKGPTRDERMSWWRDARFGMFIHWGLYAIPAGEWPMGDPAARKDHAEWIRDTAQIPVPEYEKLLVQFNPVKFDADAWAKAAADAGMKYLVITSKHHDGFCLFDSQWTDWDVMGTPFHRDILAELAAACGRHGVRFCTYHSIMDWHHPDYLPRRPWEVASRPEGGADFAGFEDYLHRQVEEVVTKYRPGVMWFDGEWESTWNHQRGLVLHELCRRLAPAMIVNNRVDVHRGGMGGFSGSSEAVGDFATPEQEIPATGVPGLDWETCMTMNDHWGFNAADVRWKSTEDLLRKLADIASKGGNFLLNVGPRADGTFPPEAIGRLAEIGAWMRVNGDAIHGTTASPFDALAFGRCTARLGESTKLYLHVFEWPRERRLVLPGLGNELGRAYLLADPAVDLPRARQDSDVWIGLPESAPDPVDSVVVLEIAGAPIVYRAPVIQADSDIFVRSMPVRMASSSPEIEVRYTVDGSEPDGTSALYGAPIVVSSTTTVRARAFHGGRGVSSVAAATFERVEPRPGRQGAGPAAAAAPEVSCERYAGSWDALPDFEDPALLRLEQGRVSGVGLAPVLPGVHAVNAGIEKVALRFKGVLRIDAADLYLFDLTSDDGSRLWIDGQLVVDNDGLHAPTTKRGRIALGPGLHDVVVGWFNRSGGADLALKSGVLGSVQVPTVLYAPSP